MTARKPGAGRKSRGPRETLITRVPPPLAEKVRDGAARSGLSITDYMANALAASHGLAPVATPPGQQKELPISA